MARSRLFVAALALCATVGVATATAATKFPTTLEFIQAKGTGDPNVLNFQGVVLSPKRACYRNRLVKFATTPAGEDGPYTPQGSDRSDGDGFFEEDVNIEGLPDVRVTAPKKSFGRRGNRKVCKKAQMLITAK